MKTKTAPTTAIAIWSRILQPAGTLLSIEAAQFFIALDIPQEDQDRVHVLAAKAREGTLSAKEDEEIRAYEEVGNLMALLKSKARQRLKSASSTNGKGS